MRTEGNVRLLMQS